MTGEAIRTGGLLRCCVASIREREGEPDYEPPAEGDHSECRYCREPIRYRDGAWEWVPRGPLAGNG